jgi:DNA end-binding protein Ku
MRSIWSGHIAFGTLLIPVRSYAASEDLHVHFHQVHKTDCGRVRYKKVCEKDGKELKADEIEKAVFIGGECIRFTNQEIENLMPARSRTMEILGFCDWEEIPVVALGKPYYIGTESPQKGGVGESFLLLKEAMEKSGKVAVVKWLLRNTEHLAMLEPFEKGFLLKLVLYFEQIRSPEEMEVIEAEIEQDLVDKALKIVDMMTFDFDWTEYSEEYTQRVRELLEKRALGEEVEILEMKTPEERSIEAELEKMLEIAEKSK